MEDAGRCITLPLSDCWSCTQQPLSAHVHALVFNWRLVSSSAAACILKHRCLHRPSESVIMNVDTGNIDRAQLQVASPPTAEPQPCEHSTKATDLGCGWAKKLQTVV